MATPTTEDIQSTDIQPLPPGHRGVAKNIPIEKLIDLRINKKLSYPQIAKIAGCTHQNVIQRLKAEGIETLQEYKENRADVFAAVQRKVLHSITQDDIKKASLYQKAGVVGLLYDKERLERNQSTQNVDVYARVQEMEQELQEIGKLEAQLGGKTTESEETA